MKKILVLGGNGFIGSNLCRYLLQQGEDVTSFDMTTPKEPMEGIHYIIGDFFDDFTLKQAVENVDVIYHAISTTNPGNSNDKYWIGYERDFLQTIKLCSMLANTDTRMIFVSSGGTVYGNHETQPLTEETIANPINHYGNLKLCIENTIRIFNFQNNQHMLIARISNAYGPGQDYKKGVGFIDAVIKRALLGESVEIWGDGNIIRDYIYIDDVCKMLGELRNYTGAYEVFNISSGVGITQNRVIEEILKLNPKVDVIYKPARKVDVQKIVLDNSRIMEIRKIDMIDIGNGINKFYQYTKEQLAK